MTYRSVPGDGLRTRWDDSPVVRIDNRSDALATVEISWATQPSREGWVARRTRLVFDDVLEYRWSYCDVNERQPGQGGQELGEIVDSDRVASLVEQDFDPDWRHFLIAFDEHGEYEVICRGVRIEYETRRPMTDAERSAERAALAMAEPSYYPAMRSCPFDGRVLLIVMDTGEDRLALHCMECGRTYDSPHDLSRVHAAEPSGSARYRPASLDDIEERGWEELLPLDEDGNPRSRPDEMDRGQN